MSNIEQYLKERNIPTDSLEANSIREGIHWATEQACEWLRLNTNWDDEWDEMGRNVNYGKIEDFKKAMEE